MNTFPTLYQLALNVVVDRFTTGLLPTNHVQLSQNVREDVFEGAMRSRCCYDDHTRSLINIFQPTKLHLDFGCISNGTFNKIQKLKLTELKIENFESILKYSVRALKRKPVGKHHFRIIYFLAEILSRETKRGLRVLDLSGNKSFGRNWMEAVSLMFPNLEVLNISNRKMSEVDFKSLCTNLPKLRYLNIKKTGIKNLKGISKLKNLEYLNIGSLEFQTEEDVQEIFELKKLMHLVFGDNLDYETDYEWLFEKPHPNLTTLTCEWEFADDAFLEKILPQLPKLQTVVAFETEISEDAVSPGISLYTADTIEAMMKSSEYFRNQGDWNGVIKVFGLFHDFWNPLPDSGGLWEPEEQALLVNELKAVIRDFKHVEKYLLDFFAIEEYLKVLQNFN